MSDGYEPLGEFVTDVEDRVELLRQEFRLSQAAVDASNADPAVSAYGEIGQAADTARGQVLELSGALLTALAAAEAFQGTGSIAGVGAEVRVAGSSVEDFTNRLAQYRQSLRDTAEVRAGVGAGATGGTAAPGGAPASAPGRSGGARAFQASAAAAQAYLSALTERPVGSGGAEPREGKRAFDRPRA